MTLQHRPDLKEQVLAAAETALCDLGFFGVSLREIAARAGLEPGTVHSMFGSKKILLLTAEARLRARSAGPSTGRPGDHPPG